MIVDNISDVIVVAMLLLMLGVLVGAFMTRRGQNQDRGITHRFIQFVGVAWVIGATVILSLLGKNRIFRHRRYPGSHCGLSVWDATS